MHFVVVSEILVSKFVWLQFCPCIFFKFSESCYILSTCVLTLSTAQGPDGGAEKMEDTIHTVEVRQSFKNHSTFFKSYLIRTVFEFTSSSLIFLYLAFSGISELNNWNELGLQEKTKLIRNLGVEELIHVQKDKVGQLLPCLSNYTPRCACTATCTGRGTSAAECRRSFTCTC